MSSSLRAFGLILALALATAMPAWTAAEPSFDGFKPGGPFTEGVKLPADSAPMVTMWDLVDAGLHWPFGSRGVRLTRYELAVITERMWQRMEWSVETLERDEVLVPLRPRGGDGSSERVRFAEVERQSAVRLLETLQDSHRLTHALKQLRALVEEAAPELRQLGVDPERAKQDVARWLKHGGKIRKQAARQTVPDPPVSQGVDEKR
jgi:hypothetical protein